MATNIIHDQEDWHMIFRTVQKKFYPFIVLNTHAPNPGPALYTPS
jgi:hypothetical protein